MTLLCYIQYNDSMMDEKQKSILENLKQELRRGAIALVAMSRLQNAQYGYAMIRKLNKAISLEQQNKCKMFLATVVVNRISSDLTLSPILPLRAPCRSTHDSHFERRALNLKMA